jgi:hypothetical protein
MNRSVFLLATDPNNPRRDVIHARGKGLKLRVFCLDDDPYHPDDGEIHLYGKGGGSMYAFESIDIASDDLPHIIEAIQWYGNYINCPELDIMADDPRPGRAIAI